jgi:hypothetical protein
MKYIFSFLFIAFIHLNAFSQRHGVYVGSGIDFTYAGKLIAYQAGVELNRHRIGFLYEERFDKFDNQYSPSYNLKGAQYVYTVYRENI